MRRVLFAAACIMLTVPAMAQDKSYTIELPATQIDQIFNLLSEQPWKQANPLIQSLMLQIQAQNAKKQDKLPLTGQTPDTPPPEK